jgi:hypothetical protein
MRCQSCRLSVCVSFARINSVEASLYDLYQRSRRGDLIQKRAEEEIRIDLQKCMMDLAHHFSVQRYGRDNLRVSM